MLNEEELSKKRKKVARPAWTHVRTLTEDVLSKVVSEESARRDAHMAAERNSIREDIFARSQLYSLFANVKGVTWEINYEIPNYHNADVGIEMKVDIAAIDGELSEYIKLSPELKKKLVKLDGIKLDYKSLKAEAQTLAAYIVVELEKDPGADLLEVISKHVNDWIKKQ
jgi:hypothetical protein